MNNPPIANTQSILQVRSDFLSHGKLQEGVIAEAIERSWRRCVANGLSANSPSSLEVVTAKELALKREQNHQLLAIARPEMEALNEQISHTRNIVILTDDEGVILHSFGGHDFLNKDQIVALSAGSSWHESHRGTNAIGTVLVEQSAITVQGAEHFMSQHHTLSCSAVPIFGPENKLVATLDVSNDLIIPQQHTLSLVKMSAQLIENRLFLDSYQSDVALHFHARPEFIETLWEGVAMFTENGQLVATNRSGLFQLGLNSQYTNLNDRHDKPKIDFNQLFDLPFASLLRQTGGANKVIIPLGLKNGARLYVQVELLKKKFQVTPPTLPLMKRNSAANLDLLNSGDAKIELAITQIKQVLSRDIPILIQGETGVGKELFARAIHDSSNQCKGSLVAVNCAALPEGLIEAELFGYQEGAFTGAKRKGSTGKIQQADGGTLFLDEIGDMPLLMQARLLRVLQERTVTPLGSTKSILVNFSLICATNQKLKEKVQSGEFRSDLYYRINGLTVTLPPLRDRSDLHALIKVILDIENASEAKITPQIMGIFKSHSWPGNIRQLHNVLRTALALADGAPISKLHLTEDFTDEMNVPNQLTLQTNSFKPKVVALNELTSNAIMEAMRSHLGNISAVARQLGISRNTLYRKLKSLGIA